MLLKLLIYLEGNWENIRKIRGDGNFINLYEKIKYRNQSLGENLSFFKLYKKYHKIVVFPILLRN